MITWQNTVKLDVTSIPSALVTMKFIFAGYADFPNLSLALSADSKHAMACPRHNAWLESSSYCGWPIIKIARKTKICDLSVNQTIRCPRGQKALGANGTQVTRGGERKNVKGTRNKQWQERISQHALALPNSGLLSCTTNPWQCSSQCLFILLVAIKHAADNALYI